MSVSKIASFFIPPLALTTGVFFGMTISFFREIRVLNDENQNNSEIKNTMDKSIQLVSSACVAMYSMVFF